MNLNLQAIIPDVVPPSVDDPIGFGLDYGDMEEGEIDDSYAGNQAEEEESEMKGSLFNSIILMLFCFSYFVK